MNHKKKLPKAIRPASASKTGASPKAQETIAESSAPPQRKTQSSRDRVTEAMPSDVKSSAERLDSSTELILDRNKATNTDPRRAQATKLVERFALWSGAAGLLPIPFLDLAAVGGLQLQMLRRISQIYGVPFSENRGKALVSSLAGPMISASGAIGAASMLKGVPILGTAVSSVTMPALSMGSTYVIGMAFIQHFSSGGTLLDFAPPDYREFIKAQNDLWNGQPISPDKSRNKRREPDSRS